MNKNEILNELLSQLLDLNEVHYEYLDNDSKYVLDVNRENEDNITITISREANEAKHEFENWLEGVDDDLFGEALEELDGIQDLNKLYETEDFQEVIDKVKEAVKKKASEKIAEYQKLLA